MAVFEKEKKEVIRVANRYKKISLDKAGQAKAIKVLISDAYRSDLRWILELTCNGIDACKEANKPVNVTVEYAEGSWMTGEPVMIIEDKGLGMSEETIDTLYTSFMASTKQNSNTAIGNFGIGSKAALKYCDQFYLETIFGGIKSRYVVGEDEDGDYGVNFLSSEDSNEETGTKVIVPVKRSDKVRFSDFIQSEFILLEGVSVKGLKVDPFEILYENDICYIVKQKYRNYQHNVKHGLSLGGVIYDTTEVASNGWGSSAYISHRIILKFNIGELKPTISREDIDLGYKDSEELIKQRFKEAVNSIQEHVDNTYNNDKYELLVESDSFFWKELNEVTKPRSYLIKESITNALRDIFSYEKGYNSFDVKKCIRRKYHIIDGRKRFTVPDYWCEDIKEVKPSKINTIVDDNIVVLSLSDVSYVDEVKQWIDYLKIPNIDTVDETEKLDVVIETKNNYVFGKELEITSDGVKFTNEDFSQYKLSNSEYIYGFNEDDFGLKCIACILNPRARRFSKAFDGYDGIIKVAKNNVSKFESLGAKMTYWKDIDQTKFKLVYNKILLAGIYSWDKFEFMQGIGKSIPKVGKLTDYLEPYYSSNYFSRGYGQYGYEGIPTYKIEKWLETVAVKDDKADDYLKQLNELYNEKYRDLDINLSSIVKSNHSDKISKLIKYYDKL